MDTNKVDLVLDVGANAGFYGQELRSFGYRGEIVSFEPLSSAFEKLQALSDKDPHWMCRRTAVGAGTGQLTLQVAANSVSSSVLPMLDRHTEAAPESRISGSETVPVSSLDDLAGKAVAAAARPFLKIDTQGYEAAVLDGAEAVLSRVVGVELELSLVPLYKGQMLMPELVARMEDHGFRLAGLSAGFWDRKTGETLQADGVFLRRRSEH